MRRAGCTNRDEFRRVWQVDPRERVVPRDRDRIPLSLEPIQDLHATVTQERENIHAACRQPSPYRNPINLGTVRVAIVCLQRRTP